MSISNEKLAEWTKLAETATAGPWHLNREGDAVYILSSPGRTATTTERPPELKGKWYVKSYPEVATLSRADAKPPEVVANAEFIAQARDALPDLMSEVEQLRAVLRHVEWSDGIEGGGSCHVCRGRRPQHYADCPIPQLLPTD